MLTNSLRRATNIQGLGQIRFPESDIKSTFEEIRRVMEREGLI